MREIEVLAPAGSFETMKAAVAAGADAVYAGGSRFGARAYAQNFTEEELLEAIDYVHLRGKKLYLTVNTLVKEKEFGDLYSYLLPYYKRGLDAVIVQDVGVMEYIKEQFPGLGIHASTQMTITNVLAAAHLEMLGVERVVPARELSLGEIRKISEETDLEIECFVHGALCYCYSGQCLLSSMIGGRSGNRGQCAQPCRLPYKAGDSKTAVDIMSLKDLCTIEHIPDLIDAGITSFKIEGRMKQPSYVATVTAMYRKYTDLYLRNGRSGFKVSRKDMEVLKQAYQRRGYCDGYYYRHNGKEMISFERPKKETEVPAEVTNIQSQEKINGKLIISSGECVKLELVYQNISVKIEGTEAQEAQKQPVTEERLRKQMLKTGNTPFVFEKLYICLNGNVFLPIQSLNEVRRQGLALLEDQILRKYRRKTPIEIKYNDLEKNRVYSVSQREMSVSVETAEQFSTAASHPDVRRIYVEDSMISETSEKFIQQAKASGKQVYFAMARIFRTEAEQVYQKKFTQITKLADGILVRNMESILYLRKQGYQGPVAADAGIYQWNQSAKKFWSKYGLEFGTAPVELNFHELHELGVSDMEVIVYGHLPVMVSAGCIRKNTSGCTKKSGQTTLTDRYQKQFTVKNDCDYCYNIIYNTSPLVLLGQQEEMGRLGISRFRLAFSTENAGQTRQMLDLFADEYLHGREVTIPEMDYTRGHFKRGVK